MNNCKNCKFYRPNFLVTAYHCSISFGESYSTIMGLLCKYYERKWWKFWVK